jgi:hypothetical protein
MLLLEVSTLDENESHRIVNCKWPLDSKGNTDRTRGLYIEVSDKFQKQEQYALIVHTLVCSMLLNSDSNENTVNIANKKARFVRHCFEFCMDMDSDLFETTIADVQKEY